VLYSGFSDHPGSKTLHGHSSLFSIILDDAVDIRAFSNALRIFRLGVSWGGPESLVVPAAAVLHQKYDVSAFRHFKLNPQLVRIYGGLENPEHLLADLKQAIAVGLKR
jgi:cystathionine beta-lyase/cystathionine gamma-synthase